jgi:hypothetical protein
MGVWTNGGLNLVASGLQTPGANCAVTYVALSLGCGTLASGLTSGTPYTALPLTGTLPVALASSQSLTISDGVASATVTTSGSVSPGATSIPITSFTPSHTFAASVTGVAPTPQTTDIALYAEAVRLPANTPGVAGASAGESLTSGYFDGTQPTGVYMLVGYFGGSTASGTLATGTLIMEDVQYWNHTLNADSNMYQADSII